MRVSSRFRALLAAFALTASVAACGDAASPTAAADVSTARQGRMLQPGQAASVKPGDFIVYRPEEYKKFGIATFSAPAGAPSAAYSRYCLERPYYYEYEQAPYDDGCGGQLCYDVNGGPISCGSDACYDRYGNYLCGQPTCYDAYGNVIQCGDPCYNSSGYYICNQPTTCYDAYGNVIQCGDPCYNSSGYYICGQPTGPATQQNYGSSAPYDGWVNTGGVLLKQVRLISFSQSIANVASFTVDAVFKNVGAGSGYGCNNTAEAFDYASAYATGTGYLEVSRVAQWNGTIKFQVDGTHTFNPVSGATGGGTFYTSSNYCG